MEMPPGRVPIMGAVAQSAACPQGSMVSQWPARSQALRLKVTRRAEISALEIGQGLSEARVAARTKLDWPIESHLECIATGPFRGEPPTIARKDRSIAKQSP